MDWQKGKSVEFPYRPHRCVCCQGPLSTLRSIHCPKIHSCPQRPPGFWVGWLLAKGHSVSASIGILKGGGRRERPGYVFLSLPVSEGFSSSPWISSMTLVVIRRAHHASNFRWWPQPLGFHHSASSPDPLTWTSGNFLLLLILSCITTFFWLLRSSIPWETLGNQFPAWKLGCFKYSSAFVSWLDLDW